MEVSCNTCVNRAPVGSYPACSHPAVVGWYNAGHYDTGIKHPCGGVDSVWWGYEEQEWEYFLYEADEIKNHFLDAHTYGTAFMRDRKNLGGPKMACLECDDCKVTDIDGVDPAADMETDKEMMWTSPTEYYDPESDTTYTDSLCDASAELENSAHQDTKSKFEQIGIELGKLVAEKNAAYGDSFAKSGDFLRLLFPDGIKPDQYEDALALVRIFDKQMRIATQKDAFGESPYRDITGYGILGTAKDES